MKKIVFLYGIVVVILVVLALTQTGKLRNVFNFKRPSSTVTINNQTYKVFVSDTQASRVKGLSGTKKLNDDQGMLFVFPEKGKYTFWMKDMNFPLDIIFINDDTITDIAKNAQPIGPDNSHYQLFNPSTNVNYVLEVNAGNTDKKNIKVGDKVQITK